ncbi:DUF1611 domain-containing protein [Arenibaculum pallidiluteum]|uniref:DUF1611 domain-containing protein n=1 Tax=Arenibaculum pallidiluteum TaxID=2812559 RepID=UPI001A95E3FA|nr:DUF1611 domain-containing protein [Arenibaculum pallidiluteum]
MELRPPYLLLAGVGPDPATGTARAIRDGRPEWCIGQMRLPDSADLGLPDLDPAAAAALGARCLVLADAPEGTLPPHWQTALLEVLEAGLDIAGALDVPLGSVPGLEAAARRRDARLLDICRPDRRFAAASARPRGGRRLLTLGTGGPEAGELPMALALARELRRRGFDADFRGTSPAGIVIAGAGVPLDAIATDFIAGAAEWLSPAAAPDHWDVVEGRGPALSPRTATPFGLLNGVAAHALVLCHRPTTTGGGVTDIEVASLRAHMEAALSFARRREASACFVGIGLDTVGLDEAQARACLAATAGALALPATDPVRFGAAAIADRLLSEFPAAARPGAE